jgi:hypothetical protein
VVRRLLLPLPEAMPAWIKVNCLLLALSSAKSKHKRLSLGLEYQRANFSANVNRYHVFSDKKLVNGLQKQERAMSGYDVKLSGQAPYPFLSIIILLLRSTQASAPKSILWLSLKALLAIEKLVNFCLLPSGSFTLFYRL